MAAVTKNNLASRHVFGDCAVRFFNITGVSGNTLDTGLRQILYIGTQPGSAITAVSYTTAGVITFTASGAITNETVMVIARVG